MFGDISGPRPLGNINNTSYSLKSLILTGNIASTSNTTGTLIISNTGGVGIGGALYTAQNTLDDGAGNFFIPNNSNGVSILNGNAPGAGTIQIAQSGITTSILGAINLGQDNDPGSINIATGGTRTLSIGNNNTTVGIGGATIAIGNSSTTNTILGTTNINVTGSANTAINAVGGTLTIGTSSTFAGNAGNVLILNGAGNSGNFAVLQNVSGTNSMTFGNETGPTSFNTHGTININSSGSSTISIGKGTYTGLLQMGGNGIDITANSTGSVSIGNGLNSIYIGSQSGGNSVVNIQVSAGSNQTNFCTGSYSGAVAIGNHTGTYPVFTLDGQWNLAQNARFSPIWQDAWSYSRFGGL